MTYFEKEMQRVFEQAMEGTFSRAELIKKLEDEYVVLPNPWEPSDYCYNITNKGISDYKCGPHLFEHVAYNKYRVLGKDSRFSGEVVNKEKQIVAIWKKGQLVLK